MGPPPGCRDRTAGLRRRDIECYNNLLLFSSPQLAFYFDVMVSFYFPDEIKVPTVDITFVVEQSVFQKNVFSWKVKVISFRIKF